MVGTLLAASCAIDAPETSRSTTELSGCFGPGCPGNSNILCAITPCELSANGSDQMRGWRLDTSHITWQPDGFPLSELRDFHVVGTNLNALRVTPPSVFGAPMTQAWDFVHTIFRARHESGTQVDFRIVGWTSVAYYTPPPPGTLPPIYAFDIEYEEVPEGGNPNPNPNWKQLCPYTEYDDAGLAGNWVFLWNGDRYDPVTAQMYDPGNTGDWFNISCAGEAGPKVLRARAGEAVDPQTTPAQRQAAMNMFIAKYCPNRNERYTVLGTLIDWSDKTGSNTLAANAISEAVWNKDGAVCLDTPRRKTTDRDNLPCEIPTCSPWMKNHWRSIGELRSGM